MKTARWTVHLKGTNGSSSAIRFCRCKRPLLSGDEKLLAVEILNTNTRKFYVELRSLEDGKIIKPFDFISVHQLKFTPDGKYLAYDIKRNVIGQIMIQSFDGGEAQALTDFQTDDIFSFSWSWDGKRLAIVRGRQLNDVVIIRATE